jgi:hypothetical protein
VLGDELEALRVGVEVDEGHDGQQPGAHRAQEADELDDVGPGAGDERDDDGDHHRQQHDGRQQGEAGGSGGRGDHRPILTTA